MDKAAVVVAATIEKDPDPVTLTVKQMRRVLLVGIATLSVVCAFITSANFNDRMVYMDVYLDLSHTQYWVGYS